MFTSIVHRVGLATGTFLTIAALAFVARNPPEQRYLERYYTVIGSRYVPLTPDQFDVATCMSKDVKTYDDGIRLHLCNR